MFVVKRNGSKEKLELEKIHDMVEIACENISGVSPSQVEMNSGLQFYEGMKTSEIQDILIRSANDLISLETPNYQYVAARLLLFGLRKEVYGRFEPLTLIDIIDQNIARGVYDHNIVGWYSHDEWKRLNKWLRHERDFNFTFAGLSQLVDKYLVQDRVNKVRFETPQYMYMLIALCLFKDYPAETRMKYVRDYYDAISTFKINLPTPILAGVRTSLRQFASCVLIEVGDTAPGIHSAMTATGIYISQRAGIGLNIGALRGINEPIRNGDAVHTGLIPFIQGFQSTVNSWAQGGLRKGSATTYIQIFHKEIEDILVLKNNKGTEDNRARHLDYGIGISKLFYERFIKNETISLFSPKKTPGLFEAFGMPEFDKLYKEYEADKSIPRKTVSAVELFSSIIKERFETGRIYIFNADHVNDHSSFLEQIKMSNLCAEVTLRTKPFTSYNVIEDTDAEVALCILSAINLGSLKSLDELEHLCDLAVRALDCLIDYQEYPMKSAELSAKNRRSIGIGYIGLAHYLAKHQLKYNDPKAWELMEETTEAFQYYLIKASNNLAKEKGPCGWFHLTKYAAGILPIDTYKKDVDQIVPHNPKLDWEALRSDVKQYGVRNTTLSALMPSESSSVISNETSGIDPIRSLMTIKKSKMGPLKQIVPNYHNLKKHYTLLWDQKDNRGYLNICAVMQKYIDQSISANTSYNPDHYENGKIPNSVLIADILYAYKMGLKTLYYSNTYDGMGDEKDNLPPLAAGVEAVESENSCESCKI